jgi:hypothetical protein
MIKTGRKVIVPIILKVKRYMRLATCPNDFSAQALTVLLARRLCRSPYTRIARKVRIGPSMFHLTYEKAYRELMPPKLGDYLKW